MKWIIPIILLALASPALASGQSAFIYSKTLLKIIPKPAETSKTLENDKKKDSATESPIIDPAAMMPVLERTTKEFTVDVHQPEFLTRRDFIVTQPFSDKEGMLILIDPPARAQVKSTRMIASADVLFVDNDGVIIKIAPGLKFATLSEPIDSGKPIHAFVYLKSGMAAASDIQPGDRIENVSFKTHPLIIQ